MKQTLLIGFLIILFYNSVFSKPEFVNYTCVDQINDIAIRNDSLWLATAGGLALRNSNGDLLKTYTNADGIKIPRPIKVAIDKQGNVWFADQNYIPNSKGVVCFDRNTFELFDTTNGLAYNTVVDLECDSSGSVWFHHYGALSKFNNNKWEHFNETNGLPHNAFLDIALDQNDNIWVSIDKNGLYMYNGTTWTNIDTSNGAPIQSFAKIFFDNEGNLWCTGWTATKLWKFDGATWSYYDSNDGLFSGEIYDMCAEENGTLWFCADSGLIEFDGNDWITHSISNISNFDNFYNSSIMIDSKGNKWIGFPNDDYYSAAKLFKFKNSTWTLFNSEIPGSFISCLSIDSSSNIWFGTGSITMSSGEGSGVFKFDEKAFTIYDTLDGLASNLALFAVTDRNGNVWFSSGKANNAQWYGVNKFDGNSWTIYDVTDGLTTNNVQTMDVGLDNTVWCAMFESLGGNLEGRGVCAFDGQTFTPYYASTGLGSNYVNGITVDFLGNVWFGTGIGLSKFNGSSWALYEDSIQGLTIGMNDIIAAPDGSIWVLAEFKLGYFTDNSWTIKDTTNGFPCNFANIIKFDHSGAMWLVSDNRLIRHTDQSTLIYTENDGLVNGFINDIAFDKDNNVWIATEYGISKLDASSVDIQSEDISLKQNLLTINTIINLVKRRIQITYSIPEKQQIAIKLYNIKGKCIETPVDGFQNMGENRFEINSSNYASGIYLCRLETEKSGSASCKLAIYK